MKTSTVTALSGYQRVLEKNSAYMYRGISDIEYRLIPKVARDWHLSNKQLEVTEKSMLRDFKIRATPHANLESNNDWEWMALAQHHGLPTRLLDWSLNPLTSLYFSCRENFDKDGAVYFCLCLNEIDINTFRSPLEVTETKKWSARHITQRIIAQEGLFTISENPLEDFRTGLTNKVVIKASAKKRILMSLKKVGVHHGSIFPDLDGIAKYVHDENKFFYGKKDKEALNKLLKKTIEDRKQYY